MRLVVLVGPVLAASLMTAPAQQNLSSVAGAATYRFMVPVCAMASVRSSRLAAAAAADRERSLRAEFGLNGADFAVLASACQSARPKVSAIATEARALQEQERQRGRSLDVATIGRFGQRRDVVLNQSFSAMRERMSPGAGRH